MNKIICRMGENYAFIKPNGEVERCCKDHSIKLGNIVNGTFRLLEEAKECGTKEICSCWRRMDVSKTYEWNKHWKGNWDQLYVIEIEKILKTVKDRKQTIGIALTKINDISKLIYNIENYIERIKRVKHDIICVELLDKYEYINKNMFKEAVSYIDSLKSKYICDMIDDTFLHINIYLARIYFKMKDWNKTKYYINLAMQYNGTYPSLYKLLAMVDFELQNYSNSKYLFKKAIKFAIKIDDLNEVSEIYYEASCCLERYYHINKGKLNKEKYLNLILKLLKLSSKYNANNISSINKIKEIIYENK